MIEIKKNQLLAATHCASKKDIRPYLNGVLVERCSNGDVHVVGCDGHRIFAGKVNENPNLPAEPVRVIIPIDVVTASCKGGGAVSLEKYDDTYWKINGLMFVPVEGTYPDWRRVFQSVEPKEHVVHQVNPTYLALGEKALQTWSGKKFTAFAKHQEGSVRMMTENDFAAVIIMPIRETAMNYSTTPFIPASFKE